MIEPLAHLIAQASQQSQLWLVTHSEALAARVAEHSGQQPIRLRMEDGETGLVQGDEFEE